MQVRLRINTAALRRLKRRFGTLRTLRWLRKPIRDSMWYMLSSIDKNFRLEGRPKPWAPWSSGYRAFREKMGPPYKKLQLAGKINPQRSGRASEGRTYALQLRRAVSVGKTKKHGWFIGTNLAYARVQQLGGFVGKYHQAMVPARPYLLFQKKDVRIIRMMFEAHINILLAAG